MRIFRLQSIYYACRCGGTFYVDLLGKIGGIAPAIYTYYCDRCGKEKQMPCEAEMKELSKNYETFRSN